MGQQEEQNLKYAGAMGHGYRNTSKEQYGTDLEIN